MADLSQQLEGLTHQQGEILKQMEALNEERKTADATRDGEIKAQLDTMSKELATLTEERRQKERDAEVEKQGQILADLAERINARAESKASLIGQGSAGTKGPTPDDFYWSLWASKTTRYPELNAEGKARLEAMGSYWADVPANSKATLGDTAGAGGNVVPPNVLGSVIELANIINPYRELMTWTNAGYVTGVDVPTEQNPIARATVQSYGATKTNLNITTGKYSATMYTLAAIYDVGNQFLRNSRGAAEQLVRDRLTRAIAFGEAYYILQGSGTSEPKGILTSLGTTTGTDKYVTAFTASSTTLAGSSAAAVAKATGVLANRFRQADGVVCNASDFWIMASQGTDTAGFFLAPAAGPAAIDPTRGVLRIWGLPVYADPNMPTDSMVVGEFKSAVVYTGQTYRVDVSDTAGTRWDTNETGFRGEEEMAFNADPYVASGIFQRITDFTP